MTLTPFSNLASAVNSLPAIVAVHCELVRGTESEVLAELLPRVKSESVTLNLANVERIDAAGIAALITLYCSSVEAGNDFSVVAPSHHVLELLRLVGLEAILVAGNQRSRRSRPCHECPAA
jgi:ABC-type transporter Mla MlaB component